jgi:hypothetical protein
MTPDKHDLPASSAEIQTVQAELKSLRAAMAVVLDRLPAPDGNCTGPPKQSARSENVEQLVTLNQIGAIVHRAKRTMEHYLRKMPKPRVHGRRGQPQLWAWNEVRPWLEATFGGQLPERFPGATR